MATADVAEEAECLAEIFGDAFLKISDREWVVTVIPGCQLAIFLPPTYPREYVVLSRMRPPVYHATAGRMHHLLFRVLHTHATPQSCTDGTAPPPHCWPRITAPSCVPTLPAVVTGDDMPPYSIVALTRAGWTLYA
jgi:hypothetical protein